MCVCVYTHRRTTTHISYISQTCPRGDKGSSSLSQHNGSTVFVCSDGPIWQLIHSTLGNNLLPTHTRQTHPLGETVVMSMLMLHLNFMGFSLHFFPIISLKFLELCWFFFLKNFGKCMIYWMKSGGAEELGKVSCMINWESW